LNFWANLSPSGFIGVVTPWGLAALFTVLVPDALWSPHGVIFAQPSFQNFPAYPLIAVSTVLVLCSMRTAQGWIRHLAPPLGVVIAAVAVGWAWVWLPSFPQRWLDVPPADTRALNAARAMIPGDAEVVVADTISAGFSGRAELFIPWTAPTTIQVGRRPVYFVMPLRLSYNLLGNEATITQLASAGVPLVLHRADIWVFRWDPPQGVHSLVLRRPEEGLAAWLFNSTAGKMVASGEPTTWKVQDIARPGMVVYGDYWTEGPGHYLGTAELSARGPVTVEVVDAQSSKAIGSVTLVGNGTRQQVDVPFRIPNAPPRPMSAGRLGQGPFVFQSFPPEAGGTVEVRVVNPGISEIDVYTLAVRPQL
jgi:hypothetical protein